MRSRDNQKKECGQGLVEYIVLVFLLAMGVVVTIMLFGQGTGDLYQQGVDIFKRQTATPSPEETPQLHTIKVQVIDDQEIGIEDVPVSIFNQDGQYLGDQFQTDEGGWVEFSDLKPGEYSFRADHQQRGFWSEVVRLPAVTSTQINTNQGDLQVIVEDSSGAGIAQVDVSAYTLAGDYVGVTETTSDEGATLSLVEGEYILKAEVKGQTYPSDPVSFPQQTTALIVVDLVTFEINVHNRQGDSLAGIPVLAYNAEGQYTGNNQTTDETGTAVLELSSGQYKFRADYQRKAYWSPEVTIPIARSITMEIGPYQVAVRVVDHAGGGISGAAVHLFNADGGFLGKSIQTNASGEAVFAVDEGAYRFRADYGGNSHWSSTMPVPQRLSTTINVGPRQLVVQVRDQFGDPVVGCYLLVYRAEGRYYRFAYYQRTERDGTATFHLPPGRYRILVYPLSGYGYQWSPFFNSQNTDQISITLTRW